MNFLLPALASILFGSVAAALVSHFLTTFRADQEYRLKKLEELYVAIEAASQHLRFHYYNMRNVASGILPWQESFEKGNALLLDYRREYSTATMIASIYFPDLVYVVGLLQVEAEKVSATVESLRNVYVNGQAYPDHEKAFAAAIQEARRRRNEACDKVVEMAATVRRGWFHRLLRRATSL